MSRWPNKYVIGLTGNIATGKSVVRQMLQHLGAYTIDADGLAHQAMSPGAPAYRPVVEAFGQIILNPDKTINRAMLGNMVFSSPDALQKLEAITHPIIGQAINTLVTRSKQPVVVIEAIKLVEGTLANDVDAVWVVDASPKTQYIRLITKRKMSEQDAKQRILSQNPQAEKLKKANVVIKNDGNVEETWKLVQAAFKAIPQPDTTKATSTQTTAQAKPATPAKTAPVEQDADVEPSPAGDVDVTGISIKRGMPNNAEAIASFVNKMTGQALSRMDVMMSFGEKSYLLASPENSDDISGLSGFQVENLITRVDEFHLETQGETKRVAYALIRAIEDASIALQSEVAFFFLPSNTDTRVVQPLVDSGYEATTVKDIKIPAWREAVQEVNHDGLQILTRKLRKDRVLKPI